MQGGVKLSYQVIRQLRTTHSLSSLSLDPPRIPREPRNGEDKFLHKFAFQLITQLFCPVLPTGLQWLRLLEF